MNIVVTGHGNFADGIKSTVKLLLGHIDEIEYVNFTENMAEQDLDKIFTAIIDQKKGTIFFCDLFGGTPFKRAAMISDKFNNTAVVAGCNIGSLIEVGMQLKNYSASAQTLAQHLIDLSKDGTRLFEKVNIKAEQNEDFTDGI